MKRSIYILNSKGKRISVDVELANNILTRMLGLMFRTSIAKNSGMFFEFDDEGHYSLWMLFTFIPLEALFISRQGKVVDIVHLAPHDLTTKTSSRQAKYILEVNEGFSRMNLVKIGSKVYLG